MGGSGQYTITLHCSQGPAASIRSPGASQFNPESVDHVS